MNYYVIVSLDIADSAHLRDKHVDTHRSRLSELEAEGRLLTAGPLPRTDSYGREIEGAQGSIIIAAFDSLEDANQWAAADPYRAHGVYYESKVYPYKRVFG
ncbi:MAG TPA: YciI family protein [Salinisphaeraceae bacterium]|nr:YciI family protein [Salinisphaeraceae bacterium]